MEVDITTHQDDESIRTKSDQFMQDRNEPNFEQVPNQEPLLAQETSTPIEQANNPLSTRTKLVQLIDPKHVESVQFSHVYIFPKTLVAYVQHESLKQVTLFFEQTTLIAQTWPQTIDNLTNVKMKYNIIENLLEDTNN